METEKRTEVCKQLAEALINFLECMSGETVEGAPQKRIYTDQELMTMFGVKLATIARWKKEGRFGELFCENHTVRVTERGLQEFLNRHIKRISPPAAPPPKSKTRRPVVQVGRI